MQLLNSGLKTSEELQRTVFTLFFQSFRLSLLHSFLNSFPLLAVLIFLFLLLLKKFGLIGFFFLLIFFLNVSNICLPFRTLSTSPTFFSRFSCLSLYILIRYIN